MLDPDCVAAIATGLTDCLHDDECDLSTAPEFQLIFLSQPPQPPTLTYLTIDERVWREWAAGRKLPTVVSAEECTDLLIATAGGWLPGPAGSRKPRWSAAASCTTTPLSRRPARTP